MEQTESLGGHVPPVPPPPVPTPMSNDKRFLFQIERLSSCYQLEFGK